MTSPRTGRPARALAVLAGYVAGGLAGLQLAGIAGAVTLVWPPTGIAIAAVVLGGRALLLPVFAGALIVNHVVLGDLPLAAAIAAGNTLEALVAATLLGRAGFDPRFASRRDVRTFGLGAGVVAPAVAAACGASALLGAGRIPSSEWVTTAAVWWAGDATGALIVGPLVLTWLRPSRPVPRSRWLGMGVYVGASAAMAFFTPGLAQAVRSALLALPMAGLVWAALRLGARGAATACAVLSAIAVAGTVTTGGFLGGGSGPEAFAPLWLFMTTAAVLSLLLTALESERGTAEQATVASEARFAGAFEHAPMGMAMVGPAGHVLHANPALAAMLRTTPEAMRGLPVTRWTEQPLVGVVGDLLHAGSAVPSTVVRVVTEHGEARHWNLRVSRLPLEGEERALLVQAEDVTQQLEDAESVRTLTEQLTHAQRMDSIGRLAGGIAHDFNNLLQAIGGNVELALLKAGDAPARTHLLGSALEAVQRARSLTGQLLAFSRPSPEHRVPTDLRRTAERSQRLLERLLPENVTLNLVVDEEPVLARVDEAQLEQVLMNICLNARDSMPQGGVIELRVEALGERVRLTTTDQGTGIPEELRERIFEPFFTTKPRGQGTGFGLAVAFGIVRAHGGSIEVGDAPGGGARLVVELPRTDERPGEVAPTAPVADADPLTILVAEDDDAVREVLSELLEGEGHRVLGAADGLEALSVFRNESERIDVLLFDVRMPRMTGPEAIRRIRAIRSDVPALLVSGYTSGELESDELDRLAIELLPKPYTRTDLLGAIARAAREREATESFGHVG